MQLILARPEQSQGRIGHLQPDDYSKDLALANEHAESVPLDASGGATEDSTRGIAAVGETVGWFTEAEPARNTHTRQTYNVEGG